VGTAKPTDPPPLPSNAELKKLLDKAQAGDASVVPTLRKLFENPAAVDYLGGDLAREAQQQLIRNFAGNNHLFAEALPRKLDLMRKEIGGPNPSPLEKLLVERIISTWLHVHQLEAEYAGGRGMTLTKASYYQQAIQRGNKCHLSAIKALAQIRRLALPAIQFNVARKQVNVLNTGADIPEAAGVKTN
jgi:hypothetical protein